QIEPGSNHAQARRSDFAERSRSPRHPHLPRTAATGVGRAHQSRPRAQVAGPRRVGHAGVRHGREDRRQVPVVLAESRGRQAVRLLRHVHPGRRAFEARPRAVLRSGRYRFRHARRRSVHRVARARRAGRHHHAGLQPDLRLEGCARRGGLHRHDRRHGIQLHPPRLTVRSQGVNAQAASPHLAPVAAGERIVALDVVRGVALLGILLMNVEFLSRPIAELESGMAAGLHGADLWIAWFVHVFVRGKFWTMFSLLFGMGFALMLLRADAKGAPFGWPYLRRTLVLALLGAAHYLLLWAGDILFAYAMGALLLLVGLVAGLRRMPPARMAKVGLAIYLLPFVLMMVGGANMLVAQPEPPSAEQAQELAQRVQEHEV